MWIHFNCAIISICCLINYSLTEGQHTCKLTHTPTHTHSHICKASISRGNNKNNGSSSSLNIFALFPFGFCKTSALQSCHNFAAPPPLPLPRWHLLLPLLVSQRKCLLVELHKKKKKKNKRRTEATATATAVSGTQAVSGLVVVVGGLPFGQLLTASCRYFCSTPILPLRLPLIPCSSHKACQSIFVCVFRFCARVRARNALGNV